ncbi:MAG: L,D-transpeptidase YbiS [Arenicella sp.]
MNSKPKQIESIEICVAQQTLTAIVCQGPPLIYSVSTARNGVGQQSGSECTPLGQHHVRAKIGGGHAPDTVFIGRRASGEIYTEELAEQHPNRDWILSRILWLCGDEQGHNRSAMVDTMRRFIYIHGAPDSHAMGVPSSHGCIKMRNQDIIELYDRIEPGTPVLIRL